MNPNDQTGEHSDPIFSTILAECPELWGIVEQFARGLPHQVSELKRAFETASHEQIAFWAQSLKSAGRDHGYPELAAYAASIERAARDHLIGGLKNQIVELNDMVTQIQAGLQMNDAIDGQ